MARPRHDSEEVPARRRLEEAFWEALERYPVGQITVRMLTEMARCNRGTFYYYFDGIDNMTATLTEEALPIQVSTLVARYLSGESRSVELDAESRAAIRRLCLLVGKRSSPALVAQARHALVARWLEILGIPATSLEHDDSLVMEFAANGVIGVLVHYAEHEDTVDLDRCFTTVAEVATKPILAFLRRSLPETAAGD